MRLVCRNRQMPQLYLALRPGHHKGTFEGRRLAMLVNEIEHCLLAFSDHGPQRNTNLATPRHAHALPQGKDRIEDCAYRTGEFACGRQGIWRANIVTSPNETCAVGFVLHWSRRNALHQHHLRNPHIWITRRSFSPGGNKRVDPLNKLSFNKHFRERWMGSISSRWCKHKFNERCDFKVTRGKPRVFHRKPPRLCVILRRDNAFEGRRPVTICSNNLGFVFKE